jgi:cysteine-rich repeat protein
MRGIRAFFAASLAIGACSGQRGDSLEQVSLGAAPPEAGAALDGALPPNVDAGPALSRPVVLPDGASVAGGEFSVTLCGNGMLDPGEECDEGARNSNTEPGACRLSCAHPKCGDGVQDANETCDNGAANSDGEPNACRSACSSAACGDGVVDPPEECDTGPARSDTEASACRSNCRAARCGDGIRDLREGCDDGNQNESDNCNNHCGVATCGDGVRNIGEECDDGNLLSGDGCQGTCRLPVCGDAVRDAGEECDDGNRANNDGCRTDCKPGCSADSECDDRRFCNGPERCVDGLCTSGTPPDLNDGVGCTVDTCSDATNAPVHAPSNILCGVATSTCANGVATSAAPQCLADRGCSTTTSVQSCPDAPSTCTPAANNSWVLTTYSPACDFLGSGCAAAAPTQRICSAPPRTCDPASRISTTFGGACNVATEQCGQVQLATETCAARDRAYCATDSSSFTTERGTCGSDGACATSRSVAPCRVQAPSCSARGSSFILTSYLPTCSPTNGCGSQQQVRDCGARRCRPSTTPGVNDAVCGGCAADGQSCAGCIDCPAGQICPTMGTRCEVPLL